MIVRNGFLIVASVEAEYVSSANYCAASIKDFYPDAHVTLFVPKKLEQHADRTAFDLVISEDVPDHTRTKLYALSRTPYTNLTVYVDADMECWHEDIQTIWDQMPSDDTDILITKIRPYNGAIAKWNNGEMIYHCGFFMYRNTPNVIKFMERWWEDYKIQRSEPWPYPESLHTIKLRPWDQFTFWKLLNVDKWDIKVDVFPDDARWNFVNGYRPNENKDPIVFWHHTIPSRQHHLGIGTK